MANQEIERKFLVKGAYKKFATKQYAIVQGFLSTKPKRTIRVRINDEKAYLTIKGLGNKSGTTRFEWEKEISVAEAEDLLKISKPKRIEKMRYIIPTNNNLFFEVDEFFGENEGLTIAEIELPSEETLFEKPKWLGKEVTGEVRYFNSMLLKNPFRKWKQRT